MKEFTINLIKKGNIEEFKKYLGLYFSVSQLRVGESQFYKLKDTTLELLALIDDTLVLRNRNNELFVSISFNTQEEYKKDNDLQYVENLFIKVLNKEITVEELKDKIKEIAKSGFFWCEEEYYYELSNNSIVRIYDYPTFTSIEVDMGNKIMKISNRGVYND